MRACVCVGGGGVGGENEDTSCMSTVISECQDGYYKEGAQCVQCSSNCAARTKCNKDTGKCDSEHGFVCIMGRKSAMT